MKYLDKSFEGPYPNGWAFDPRNWNIGVEWGLDGVFFSIGPFIYSRIKERDDET